MALPDESSTVSRTVWQYRVGLLVVKGQVANHHPSRRRRRDMQERQGMNEQGSKDVGSEFLKKMYISSVLYRLKEDEGEEGEGKQTIRRTRPEKQGPTPPRPARTGKSSRKKKPRHAPTTASRTTHQQQGERGPATAQQSSRTGQAILPSRGLWHQPRIGLMCDRGLEWGIESRDSRRSRGRWRLERGTEEGDTVVFVPPLFTAPLGWPAIRVFFCVTQGQRER